MLAINPHRAGNAGIVRSSASSAPHRDIPAALSNGVCVEGDWADGIVRRVAAKGHLFTEGDTKSHVYKVTSGAVCLYRVLADGRRQIIEFAFQGDVIGLGSASIESCNAQAIAPTRVKCLPLAALLKAAKQDVAVALGLYEALSRELVATREHLQCIGKRGATERLASFLVILSRRNQARDLDPLSIMLPMTRVDIADFLGLTIETVSRTFTKLKYEGLIEIDRTTTIHLRDSKKLAQLANGVERI